MDFNKIINAAMNAFKQKVTDLYQNSDTAMDKLDEKSFTLMTSALLEAARAAGQTGLVEFLKQHDTIDSHINENGKRYRYKGLSPNELLTLFGTITVDRAMYYNEQDGGSYLFPLDRAIGMDKDDFATLETREMILFASASCVPQELADLLKKCSLCNPSRTAIQNIINKDGEAMEAFRDVIAQNVLKERPVPSTTQAIVASLDGANVLLREPGEKKGRKNRRPGGETKSTLSPTSYHNAMVGAVSFYGTDTENKPQRLSSLYTARMPQEKATDFKDDFEMMIKITEQTVGEKSVHKILLTDGHLMIKGFAKKSKLLQSYEKLLDFYHTTEHLAKAADVMYGEKTERSKWWYTKWREALKIDDKAPRAILLSIKNFRTRHTLSAKRSEELKTQITFFRKNQRLMNYARFIVRGLPIGSGPIEAAAKTIVKQRMCRSGMRWSREKGQYVLTIKAYVQSGVWDKAWNHYTQLKKAA